MSRNDKFPWGLPVEFQRADPDELAKFDPSTKICTMNCGQRSDDPRSPAECKMLCDDCQKVSPKPPAPARVDIIRMAREAGAVPVPVYDYAGSGRLVMTHDALERFATIATERERTARQASQVENEDLKARLARAGIEQRKAVLEEREACAHLAQQYAGQVGDVAWTIAGDIRARSRA